MIWKTITGFPNYEISKTGDVRNIKTEKVLKGSYINGSLRYSLHKKGKQHYKYQKTLLKEQFE